MKNITLIFSFAAIMLFCGCGYKFGSLSHPQLETISVAPVVNETTSYNASAILRGMLCERITTDGSMELESTKKSDCILYARITDEQYKAVDYPTAPYGGDAFLANEWKCTVTVEYSLILPGRGKPLIKNRKATGSSEFITGPDLETSRMSSMRQAFFAAAKDIVSAVTEGW
jgi:hypothetical protein